MKLLVATLSAGKQREIREILEGIRGIELLFPADLDLGAGPPDDIEVHDSFEENAIAKARWFRARLEELDGTNGPGGIAVVADDSGLAVEALGGAPGVRSKRFAPDPLAPGETRDEANIRHLLARMQGIPEGERGAAFVCVAALIPPGAASGEDPEPRLFRGEAKGEILGEREGEGGFGYDPLFRDPSSGKAFASLTAEEKNARSHRGAAFRRLAEALRKEAIR